MNRVISEVTARMVSVSGEETTQIDKYVLITQDGELFIDGMNNDELRILICKLMKVAVSKAIEGEYIIREATPPTELVEDLRHDEAEIGELPVSYNGQMST